MTTNPELKAEIEEEIEELKAKILRLEVAIMYLAKENIVSIPVSNILNPTP